MTDSTTGYGYEPAPIVDQPGYVAHGLPSSVNRGGLVETYAYDARGRMARKTRFGLTFGFEWNADGQLWKIQYPRTPQPNATTSDPNDPSLSAHNEPMVEYQFDAMGRSTGSTLTHRWGSSSAAGQRIPLPPPFS